MAKLTCNEEMKDRIIDLRDGLHEAMTALITHRDRAKAESILHQMDARFGETLDSVQIIPG